MHYINSLESQCNIQAYSLIHSFSSLNDSYKLVQEAAVIFSVCLQTQVQVTSKPIRKHVYMWHLYYYCPFFFMSLTFTSEYHEIYGMIQAGLF